MSASATPAFRFSKGLPEPAPRWTGLPRFNFVGGHNDPAQIPTEALAVAAASVLRREGSKLAIYNLSHGPMGYPGLPRGRRGWGSPPGGAQTRLLRGRGGGGGQTPMPTPATSTWARATPARRQPVRELGRRHCGRMSTKLCSAAVSTGPGAWVMVHNLGSPWLDTMMAALEEEFGTAVEMVRPEGGIFLWLKLPDAVDVRRLVEPAAAAGLQFNPGPEWSCNPDSAKSHMRLCFALPEHAEIREGVKALARLCFEEFGIPAQSANVRRV